MPDANKARQVDSGAAPERPVAWLPGLMLFAGLTLVWGCNFPVMKIALSEAPVWWYRSACVLAGGTGLLGLSAIAGARLLPDGRQVPALITCALFAVVGWHMLTGYGLTLMPAGRAVIITNTMPVWAALFATFLLAERLTATKIAGLALGMIGLAVLIGPDLADLQQAPVGALLMVCAAMSWAMGTVLFKRTAWATGVAVTAGWMLLIAAVPITAGAALLQPFPDVSTFRTEVWLAIAYTFLLPMIFGQWAYYRIVHLFSAIVAAIGTMAIPVIGVIASSLLVAEPIGERDLIALALISSALVCVLILPALRGSKP